MVGRFWSHATAFSSTFHPLSVCPVTGRPVDATEAATMGLVNRVVPAGAALTAAVELAQTMAKLCVYHVL